MEHDTGGKNWKKRADVALTPPAAANLVEEESMEDESHDSKLAKAEEIVDAMKHTLRDGSEP